MRTYICSLCGHVKNIESHKKKNKLKSRCGNCNKKTKFSRSVETTVAQPVTDFASRYTLAGDLTIMDDYVHVEGINVKGNVNLQGSIGSNLRGMKIMPKEDKPNVGNINIDNSSVGSVNNNVVGGNVNVRGSQLGNLDSNIIGFTFDHDTVVLEAINSLINGNDLSSNLEKLLETQDILNNNTQISEKLGSKLYKVNEDQKGALRDSIFRSLKKHGLETLNKAKNKGLDKLVAWIFSIFSN